MTPFARRRIAKSWALVAILGISAIASIEAYALSQGINGTALTASMAALGGAGAGRLFKRRLFSPWEKARMRA